MGRRWNRDPKPNVSISPYATFENNPIWHTDPLGDTLGDPNWFSQLVQWMEKPSWAPFEKGGAVAQFNDNFNPIGVLYNHGSKIITGKDRYGDPIDYRGRMGAVTDAGTDIILYLTGEKLFKVVLGPKNAVQVMEQQLVKNEAAIGTTKPIPTPPSPKLTPGQQLQVNNAVSKISEDIVEQRLKAGLASNEIIIRKPRFYIGDSKKYATPDFAIYNKDIDKFVKIVDAKNGGADFTRGQKQLNQYGGRFQGSKRFPGVKPQSISPNMVQKETTNISY